MAEKSIWLIFDSFWVGKKYFLIKILILINFKIFNLVLILIKFKLKF